MEFTNADNINIPDDLVIEDNTPQDTNIQPQPTETADPSAMSFTQPNIGFNYRISFNFSVVSFDNVSELYRKLNNEIAFVVISF